MYLIVHAFFDMTRCRKCNSDPCNCSRGGFGSLIGAALIGAAVGFIGLGLATVASGAAEEKTKEDGLH